MVGDRESGWPSSGGDDRQGLTGSERRWAVLEEPGQRVVLRCRCIVDVLFSLPRSALTWFAMGAQTARSLREVFAATPAGGV